MNHFGSHPNSLIVKFLAAITVKIPGSADVHAVLMANSLPAPSPRGPSARFDLKGSTAGRGRPLEPSQKEAVRSIVDTNSSSGLVSRSDTLESLGLQRDTAFRSAFPKGLWVPAEFAAAYRLQTKLDSSLLEKHNIMDYSLLVHLSRVTKSQTQDDDSHDSGAGKLASPVAERRHPSVLPPIDISRIARS